MTSLAPSSSSWISHAKVGLTLAFLVSMSAQAAPNKPAPPDPNDTDRVIVSTDKGKNPHKHRNLKRGPSQPEKHATKPQQQVHSLR